MNAQALLLSSGVNAEPMWICQQRMNRYKSGLQQLAVSVVASVVTSVQQPGIQEPSFQCCKVLLCVLLTMIQSKNVC